MQSNEIIQALNFYYSNPVAFVQDIIGANPEPEQAAFLSAMVDHRFITIKSGHGIGKSAGESWAALWFMRTRPNAKVACTAPTGHQLDDVLWPEIGKWLKKSLLNGAFEYLKTKLWMKGYEETWFCVPHSCSKPENLQGMHGENMFFIVDEASGVPKENFEVIEGALTNEGAYLLLAGNPTLITGTFYDSFHRDRKLYKTFTFNAETSKLVSPDYCERIALKFGKESDVYLVRVLGDFPRGNPDSLIRLDEIEPAINRKVEEGGIIEIGVDPARYGNNMSVICSRRGRKCLGFKEFSGINTPRLTGEVSLVVKELRKEYDYYEMDKETWTRKMKKIRVKVDDTGIGGGVTDQLQLVEESMGIEVIPVNNGGKSYDPDYFNKGAQLWGNIKNILPEISIPDDDELIMQFTGRKYRINPADGTIMLERKEDMEKRGLVSPDKADALSLAFSDETRRMPIVSIQERIA
jgi:hypothetical protein